MDKYRTKVLAAAVLLTATFIAYLPALNGEFLLDDDVHVTRPELRSLAGLARIWTDVGATQQYYPVVHTSFWLEHRLWGDTAAGYHITNVLLHVASALLVVAITHRLRLPGGWLAGFVFALHPVCVESVAWIAEQKNTLSAAFGLAAVFVYLRFEEVREAKSYAMASVLFALALLSKTAMAMIPAVLLVMGWWRRGRVDLKRDALPLLPWAVAAAGCGLVTLAVEGNLIAGISADVSMTWSDRVSVASQALWFYFAKLLWPANLSFFYERWPSAGDALGRYGFVGATLAAFAALIGLARRTRGPLAAAALFAVMLLPVLGFLDVQWFVFSYVADHFQYLASIGIIVPLCAWLAQVAGRFEPGLHGGVGVAAVGLVVLLGLMTGKHSATFRSNVALYTNAVVRTPGSAVAHNHLGVAFAKLPDRLPAALAEFDAALRLNPNAAETHENLGVALLRIPGREDEARAHLEAALRLKPALQVARQRLAGLCFDLGKALASQPGRTNETLAAYERALELDPNFAEAHFNLGNVLLKNPARLDDAIARFEAAVRLKPDFAEAHTNLGSALARSPGGLPRAIRHFEAALRADPDFGPARNNLSRARQLQGETSRDDG